METTAKYSDHVKLIISFTGERCLLFSPWTKTFNICLICCCRSQENPLSTFGKTRALQGSPAQLLLLVPAIWTRLSYLSGQLEPRLRRIDPSWGGRKAAGDVFLQTAALKCLSGTFLLLRRRDKTSIRARVQNRRPAADWELGHRMKKCEPHEREPERNGDWRKTKFKVCGVRRCCQCVTQYPVFTDQGSAHNTSMFSVEKCQIMRFFPGFPCRYYDTGGFQ